VSHAIIARNPRPWQLSDDQHGVPHPRNDNRPPIDAAAFGRALVGEVIGGLRFYSRVPIGFVPYVPPELTRLAPVLPVVSFLLGFVPAALLVVLTLCGLPSIYAAGIAVAFSLILTGAMAEDALADAFDGLFGGPSPEVRLDIMRDSRHGTYGVSALVLLLLLRVFAVGGIAAVHPFAGAAAWLASGIVARSGSLWLPLALPAARASGVSAAAGRVAPAAFWVGAAIALVLCVVLAIPFAGTAGIVVALVLAALTIVLWTMICRNLIGGQTGDCVGALQALIEIAMLSALFAFA
jgi:adenosylcobinamide-GDP ribazoletransferase